MRQEKPKLKQFLLSLLSNFKESIMKKVILLSFLILCSCVQNRFLYTDNNGNNVYQSDCSDLGLDFGDCLIDANKTCPVGFDIVMSSENPVANFSNYSTHGTTMGYGNFFSSNYNTHGNSWNAYSRYIIYACKQPK